MSEPLTAFSLRIYREGGVRDALLALQDEAGCDVTLLLWAMWLASRQRATGSDLQTALNWSREWGEGVTAPLRAARRAAKPLAADDEAIAALRERIKAVELETEMLTLERLERVAPGDETEGGFAALARRNLESCAQAQGLSTSFETLIASVSRAVKKM